MHFILLQFRETNPFKLRKEIIISMHYNVESRGCFEYVIDGRGSSVPYRWCVYTKAH